MAAYVYSFKDVSANIVGPGLSASLGNGAGVADGGIVITAAEDKNTMVLGCDGSVVHSLHVGTPGSIKVTIQQGSPTNNTLSTAFAVQTANTLLHGKNTITIRTSTGDNIVATDCAFKKEPDMTYGKDATSLEWEFDCGNIVRSLGTGTPEAS